MTYAIAGALLTLTLFLATVIFRTGHLTARIESLEAWRVNMRTDMHEVSDKIDAMSQGIRYLTTLLEERTDRRG